MSNIKISKVFLKENVLPIVSAIALATPFLFYSAGWLSLVCMLPFLYYLDYVSKNKSGKNYIFSIWAVGAIFFFIVVQWLLNTRPDNWAYIEGWQGGIGLLVIYLIVVSILSLQFLIFGLIHRKLKINLFSKWSLVVLPAVWVVAEYLRSVLFSIITYGPNGSIGPFWNFGVLGFAGAVTPLGFTSRIAGLYGLSFIIVAINLAIFWLVHRRYKLPLVVFGVILVITILSTIIFSNSTGSTISVTAVQLPPTDDNSLTTQYQQQLKQDMQSIETKNNSIDLLLLPEYSEFFTNDDGSAKDITKDYLNLNGGVVTSINGTESEGAKASNDLVVYSQNGEIQARHEKQFLIPVGEYMPYIIATLLRITGQSQALEINESTQTIKRGEHKEPTVNVAGRSIGALACSAAIAPELYRSMVTQGAEILTNSASLGTFTYAPLYHSQSRQMARFDAIANARPFVQASTGAYSYFIDQNGKFIYRTTKTGLSFKQLEMQTNKNLTWYSRFGEWVVFVSLILTIVLLVRAYARK
jgi:apolipoprotein N-acyltransferase